MKLLKKIISELEKNFKKHLKKKKNFKLFLMALRLAKKLEFDDKSKNEWSTLKNLILINKTYETFLFMTLQNRCTSILKSEMRN